MVELWFGLLGLMLVVYVVLDGFDFGAGVLHLFVAKSDAERRTVLSAIGPFWDGNEVWLIGVGGVLFVAFPELLTTAFPAFYLALHLVLWCFALRGVAIEVRSHVTDAMWRALWDAIFAVASTLLALLFGVAFGNVVRGVPVDATRSFTLPFFTNFRPSGQVGLLDYYSISVGFLAVVLLAAHGAAFLAWRTQGVVRARCLALERKLWPAVGALFVLVSLQTQFVRPELVSQLIQRPSCWLAISIALGGAALLVSSRRGERDGRAFLGSCALIAGVLAPRAPRFTQSFFIRRSTRASICGASAVQRLYQHALRARLVAIRVRARRLVPSERIPRQPRACWRRLLSAPLSAECSPRASE